ncbi:uncharacterized protein [Spinacia oleracea]|uniref:G-box binding protein multifunctional mosaic region domain-containing protein n=1 Tax=Spinacia oleracea TaxID=3562 RepID=A0ABM3QYN8_SPIOL|nr:uncharacterized protein LOC130463389 [Spinacia oleracea]
MALSPFSKARSSLLLEERELAAMAAHGGGSSLVATADNVAPPTDGSGSNGSNCNKNRNNRNNFGNKNRDGGGRGCEGWQWVPNFTSPPPPCPFSTQAWAKPTTSPTRASGQQRVLGSYPQHVYAASGPTGSYVPTYVSTDIESAMHTMTMAPPDSNWYMVTGATSHMTSSNGISRLILI